MADRNNSMFTHELSKHPIYKLWHQIKKRCHNPNDISFKWYGDKGIKMCAEWESNFELFYPVDHKGYLNPNSKLTVDSFKLLKDDLINNLSITKLSTIYKISRAQIYCIKNGLRWISDPLIQ